MLTAVTRVVEIPSSGALADLLGGWTRSQVFTAVEVRRCAERSDFTGWAGRFAAKLAVAELLGLPTEPLTGLELAGIEIVPDHGQCPDPQCVQSHPPAVRLVPALAEALAPGTLLRVSISHTRRLAIAIAVLTSPFPVLPPRNAPRTRRRRVASGEPEAGALVDDVAEGATTDAAWGVG